MKTIPVIFSCALLVVLCGCTDAPEEASKSADHSVRDQHTVAPVTVDLDRDGKPDQVSLELAHSKAVLTVRYGSGNSEQAEFAVAAGQQFGVCPGDKISLQVERQSDGLEEALGEIPEGYRVCEFCYEVQVIGGECDPLQFYWNEKKKALGWWRT